MSKKKTKKRKINISFFDLSVRGTDKDGRETILGVFPFEEWVTEYFSKANLKSIVDFGDFKFQPAEIDRTEDDMITLRMYKIRDDIPPAKIQDHKEAEDLGLEKGAELGEPLLLLYDPRTNILTVQIFRSSLTISNLSQIFNKWYKSTSPDQPGKVKVLEIFDKTPIDQLRENKIRSIDFCIANVPDDEDTSVKLTRMFGECKPAPGYSLSLRYSSGRKRDRSVDHGLSVTFFDLFESSPDLFSKAKIGTVGSSGSTETHDLIKNSFRKTIILDTNSKGIISIKLLEKSVIPEYQKLRDELYSKIKGGR